MAFRPRFAGYTRWDDHTREEEIAEPDVELLPYTDDPGYLEQRREAQLLHYREQLRIEEHGGRSSSAAAALWRRLLAEATPPDWSTGQGDRRLF